MIKFVIFLGLTLQLMFTFGLSAQEVDHQFKYKDSLFEIQMLETDQQLTRELREQIIEMTWGYEDLNDLSEEDDPTNAPEVFYYFEGQLEIDEGADRVILVDDSPAQLLTCPTSRDQIDMEETFFRCTLFQTARSASDRSKTSKSKTSFIHSISIEWSEEEEAYLGIFDYESRNGISTNFTRIEFQETESGDLIPSQIKTELRNKKDGFYLDKSLKKLVPVAKILRVSE